MVGKWWAASTAESVQHAGSGQKQRVALSPRRRDWQIYWLSDLGPQLWVFICLVCVCMFMFVGVSV